MEEWGKTVVNAWAEVVQKNGNPKGGVASGGGKPTLFIHARCWRLIQTLLGRQRDPKGFEDVLKVVA